MQRLKLLILEDDKSDAELLELSLRDAGLNFEPTIASGRAEFVQNISNGHAPDLVLSDFSLPDINGIEAKELMRDKGLDIPFILVTGVLDNSSILSVIRSGVSDMVLKNRMEEVPAAVHRAIREHKERKARLAKDNENKALLDNIGDVILKLDQDYKIQYASASLEFQLNWKTQKVLGKNIELLIAGPDKGLWSEFVQEIESSTHSKSKQIRMLNTNGEPLWAAITLSNHLKTEGLNCYLLTAKVIDEQVKTRAELEQVNDYLPGAVYRFRIAKDGEQQLEYISKGITNVTGFGPEEYEDDFLKVILNNVHEKDYSRFMSTMLQSIQDSAPFKIEFRGLHRDESRPWFYINATPHVENNGDTVFIGMITDISREKEAEFKASELGNKLESVVSAAEVGIWEYDLVSDKFTVNNILAAKLDYKLTELQGMSFQVYGELIHPSDLERVQKNIQDYVTDEIGVFDNEYRLKTKDGQWLWFSARGAVVKRNINRKPLRLMGTLTDITEMKTHEQNLSAVFELSPMPKFLFDPHSLNIKMANRAAVNMYGFSEEELKRMSINHVAGDNLPQLWQGVNHVVKHGQGKFNTVHRAKNNKRMEVFVSATKIMINNEEQILIAVLDETEKRKAEREIEKLSLVASKATNGVVITGKDEVIEWVNDGFTELSGYSAEELIGKKPKDVLQGSETSKASRAILRQAVDEGKEAYAEIINYHKENGAYWVEVYLSPIHDNEGNVIKFIAIQNDISERKANEAERTKLSSAISQSPASVIITDADGNITYVNPKFEEVSGYSSSEVMGENPRILKSGQTSKEEYEELWNTLLAGKTWVGELQNKRKDKSLYWERASIGPILDDNGKVAAYVSVKEDITELKVMQDQLKKALKQMETQVEERTKSLADAKQIAEEKSQALTDSIHYALRIQQSVVPSPEEVARYFSESMVIYQPKDIVSGDFYWVKEFEDKIFLAVVDCTGHGVPGALLSMVGTELLDRHIVQRRVRRSDQILEEMDYTMYELLKRNEARFQMNDGMDMSLCIIDKKNMRMNYASAKSYGMIVKTNGDVIKLENDRESIGGYNCGDDKRFTPYSYDLEHGDKIYMYTDGIIDQFGGKYNKKLKNANFMKLIERHSSLSMADQTSEIEAFMDKWKGGNVQIDDITLVGIKV